VTVASARIVCDVGDVSRTVAEQAMSGLDGEEAPAESIVPDAKEYIAETIDNPEATYDPKIWDTPGFALVLSWLAQKWRQRCQKLANEPTWID
jgi:hypothetical protein